MNIQQMHTAFRTMGQQAGLQLVRGVLPEAIDVYLNDTIFEITRQELLASAKTVFQDGINTQSTALGAINILRTLYRTKNVPIPINVLTLTSYRLSADASDSTKYVWLTSNVTLYEDKFTEITVGSETRYVKIEVVNSSTYYLVWCNNKHGVNCFYYSDSTKGHIYTIGGLSIPLIPFGEDKNNAINIKDDVTVITKKVYPDWIKNVNNQIGYYEIYLPSDSNIEDYYKDYISATKDDIQIYPMMYIGCSLQYDKDSIAEIGGFNGNNRRLGAKGLGDHVGTRLIGGDVLETTFRDYCNAASVENPVVSLMSDHKGGPYVEIYTNTQDIKISTLVLKYIKLPNMVKFDTDITKCVNCDLPEYIHYEIVRRAIAKMFITMSGGQNNNNNNKE